MGLAKQVKETLKKSEYQKFNKDFESLEKRLKSEQLKDCYKKRGYTLKTITDSEPKFYDYEPVIEKSY